MTLNTQPTVTFASADGYAGRRPTAEDIPGLALDQEGYRFTPQ